jgi:hypothetical protein
VIATSGGHFSGFQFHSKRFSAATAAISSGRRSTVSSGRCGGRARQACDIGGGALTRAMPTRSGSGPADLRQRGDPEENFFLAGLAVIAARLNGQGVMPKRCKGFWGSRATRCEARDGGRKICNGTGQFPEDQSSQGAGP